MTSDRPPTRGVMDWEQIKERLARAQQALAASERLTPEQAREVMDRRARLLSAPPSRAPDTSEILEVAIFSMGDERHAIETRYIRAVVETGKTTPIPGGPDFVVGLTNLRGEVLAVLDLRQFFGMPPAAPGPTAKILVLGVEHAEFGALADSVEEVAQLRIDQILPAPKSLDRVAREMLRGVTPQGLLVLDGDALLRDSRLVIDESD